LADFPLSHKPHFNTPKFVVGVDGCRAGWLAVNLAPAASWDIAVFPAFAALWKEHRGAALLLVDIPIGLKDGGSEERRCDQEARRLLGPRRSSVFPAPCRPAVYAPDYDAAIRENRRRTGRSIFKATWNITPKIREVDEVLLRDAAARRTIREVHPEVCFWAINGGAPLSHAKKTAAGFRERLELLKRAYPEAEAVISKASAVLPRRDAAPDDLLDALAAAVTALLGQTGLDVIPAAPEQDARGLPMEMVHLPVRPARAG
jgi:predicted RNase H-like nuclease